MNPNNEEKRLLVKCLDLVAELQCDEPETWKVWLRREWEEQMDFGPRYLISRWFGPLPERERARFRRAIDRLEERGLIITTRQYGTRLSHIRLTEAGIQEAARLSEEPEAEESDKP